MSTNKNQRSIKKAAMLSALHSVMGNVTKACEVVEINRSTHYEYMKDPDYKQAVEDLAQSNIDFAESKLRELISGWKDQPPCKTAIIFYLKTQGKERGYVERTEQVLDLNEDAIKKLKVEFIDGSK